MALVCCGISITVCELLCKIRKFFSFFLIILFSLLFKCINFNSRVLVGTFLAFDRHMNIVLGDTEEFRKIRTKKGSGLTEEREEKRALGLIILRGDSVVSLTIDGPPPPETDDKLLPGGPGVAKLAAARGIPLPPTAAPIGLTGPVRGIGGPGLGIMQPPAQSKFYHLLLL